MVLITAVTATRNRPDFIRKAIELFEAQTWPSKELLVVADDDDTTAIPNAPGVRVVRIPKTWPQAKRRAAYPFAQGEIIAHWDDDDYFAPNRLEVQAECLAAGAGACGFPTDYVVQLPGPKFCRWTKGNSARLGFHDCTIAFRRELLTGIPDDIQAAGQIEMACEFRRRGARIEALPNNGTFVYARHSSNSWQVDLEKMAAPCSTPAWIPQTQLDFWESLERRKP